MVWISNCVLGLDNGLKSLFAIMAAILSTLLQQSSPLPLSAFFLRRLDGRLVTNHHPDFIN